MPYHEVLECELSPMLEKFILLSPDLYSDVSRSCLSMFCKGMHEGYRQKRTGLVMEVVKTGRGTTPEEHENMAYVLSEFFRLGHGIGYEVSQERNAHPPMLDMADAAEFLSERLGCKAYCWETIESAFLLSKDQVSKDQVPS